MSGKSYLRRSREIVSFTFLLPEPLDLDWSLSLDDCFVFFSFSLLHFKSGYGCFKLVSDVSGVCSVPDESCGSKSTRLS